MYEATHGKSSVPIAEPRASCAINDHTNLLICCRSCQCCRKSSFLLPFRHTASPALPAPKCTLRLPWFFLCQSQHCLLCAFHAQQVIRGLLHKQCSPHVSQSIYAAFAEQMLRMCIGDKSAAQSMASSLAACGLPARLCIECLLEHVFQPTAGT